MAARGGTTELAIAYRHVPGGEREFLRTGEQIRASGRQTNKEISALDRVMGDLGERVKSIPGPIGAVARALSDLYGKLKGLPVAAAALTGAIIALVAAMTAMVAAAIKALDAFADFEQAMKNVQVAGGASADELEKLTDKALEAASATRFDPGQTAEALYNLASAGYSVDQSLSALLPVLNFAEAAQTDLGTSSDTLVASMKGFRLESDQAVRVADVFTAAMSATSLNAQKLNVAMANAGPTAAGFGHELEETVAAVGLLTDVLGKGERAGTGYQAILNELKDKHKELGIEIKDSAGNYLPMVEVLKNMEAKGFSAKNAIELFGNDAGPALAILLAKGSKGLAEMEARLKSNGQAAATAGEQMDTLKGDQEQLAGAIEEFWVRLGQALSDSQRTMVQEITKIVQKATAWVKEHADEIAKTWTAMTKVIIFTIEALVKTIAFLVDHFDQLQAAVIAVASAFAAWKLGTIIASIITFTSTMTLADIAIYAQVVALEAWDAVLLMTAGAWETLSAAMLANPIGIVAAALGLLVYWLVRSYQEEQAFQALQLKRSQTVQQYGTYIDQLRGRVDLLTEAEAEHGRQLLANLKIEAEAARVAADRAKKEDPEAARSRAGQQFLFGRQMDDNVPYSKQTQAAVAYADQLKQSVSDLEEEMARLGGLSDETITVTATLADTFGELDTKLRDAIKSHKLAAEQALLLYKAHQQGGSAIVKANRDIEIQNALLSAGTTIATAAGKQIAYWVGVEFDAKRATDLLVDSQARLRDVLNQEADARANVLDVIAGNTDASTAAARAAEVEAFMIENLLDADDSRVSSLRRLLEERDRQIKMAEIEADNAQKAIDFQHELGQAEAELQDAKNRSTRASAEYSAQLEIEARVKKLGTSITQEQFLAIMKEVYGRQQRLKAIKDETAAQQRQNDFDDEYKRALADQSDYLARIELTNRYGKELAGIMITYGEASEATRDLARQEEALAIARGEGSENDAARLAEIRAEVDGRHDQIDALMKYREQMAIIAHLNEPINDAWQRTKETITDVVGDVLSGTEVDWKRLLQSMVQMWIKALVEMAIRWATYQAARVATAQAADATIAASGAAANAVGGGGGGGMGGMMGMMGGGGGMWGSILGSKWGSFQFGNMAGGGSGAGLAGAAGFAVAAAIVINWLEKKGASWARSSINFGGSQGIGIGDGKYDPQGANSKNNAKNVKQVLDQAIGIIAYVRDFVKQLGGEIDLTQGAMGSMSIEKKGQGKKTQWIVRTIDGIVKNFGKDMDAAMEYAAIQAIKAVPTVGLSPEVAAAIKASTAEKMEDFQRDIELALKQVHSRLGEVGSQVYDTFHKFDAEIEQAKKLGISIDLITAARKKELDGIKNSLLGIDSSAADHLAAIVSYQAGVAEVTNQIHAQVESVLGMTVSEAQTMVDQYSALLETYHWERTGGNREDGFTGRYVDAMGNVADEATAAILRQVGPLRNALHQYAAQLGSLPEKLTDEQVGMAIFDTLYQYLQGSQKYEKERLAFARMKVDLEFQAIKLQLVALNMWDKYAQMWTDAYNAAMNGAAGGGRRGGGGAGSQKGQDQDSLRETLKDHDWDQRTRGMSDYTRGVAEINKKWDEAIPLAHGNKDLLAQIAKARKEEIDALRETAREQHREELKPYLEDYGKSDLTKQMEALRKRFDDARKSAKELGEAKWKVDLAEKRAMAELGQSAIASLGLPSQKTRSDMKALGDTLDFLRTNMTELGLTTEDLANITAEVGQQMFLNLAEGLNKYVQDEGTKKELAQMRYDLEIANYKLQFELLKNMGILTDEQIAKIQGLIDKLPTVVPDVGGGGGGDDRYRQQQEAAQQAMADAAAKRAEDLKTLTDQVKSYEDLNLSGPVKELRDLNATFDEMRAKAHELGFDMSRLEAAYRTAIADFWDRLLEPLRQFQNDLLFRDDSPLSAEQRLQEAQRRFDELAARAAAGDLDAIAQIPEAAQLLLDQARAFYNSGAGFQDIFAQVQAVLAALLAMGPAQPSPAVAAGTPTPVVNAAGNLLNFPTPPPAAAAPTSVTNQSQGQPIVVQVTGGGGDNGATRAEVADLKVKLLELEREILRVNLEAQQEREQTNDKLDEMVRLMGDQNAFMQRLLAKLAGEEKKTGTNG